MRTGVGMMAGRLLPVVLMAAAIVWFTGCAPTGGGRSQRESARPVGAIPVGLEFLHAYENLPGSAYFPLDGVAGCCFGPDGTLLVCDEKRGKVHALDPRSLNWYEFDAPNSRPYQPLDAVFDGLKVLVLDRGGTSIHRFDLSGAWLNEMVDIRRLDRSETPQPTSFAVDRDGRLIIGDAASQQVLLLDGFLALHLRIGGPGTVSDQFRDPAGLTFLADGSFIVADRGNRRLSLYGRLGFFETTVGGDFEVANPFVAPQGLCIDRFGNLFVADPGAARIHVLDHRQRLLFSAGPEFSLQGTPTTPLDVAVGPDDTLAVTDRSRAAILLYRIVYE